MIGKTRTGKGFTGTLNYLLEEKKKAEILHSNNIYGENPRELARRFRAVSNNNPNVTNVVWHTSLSFDDKDNITREQMIEAAERFMAKAGFSKENNQYMIIEHNDTAHKHIHICANRVGFDGKSVDDSFCQVNTVKWSKEIEIEMNLVRVEERKAEIARSKVPATDKAKKRVQLWADRYLSRDGAKSFEEMAEYLKKQDIDMKVLYHSNTGEAYGVSFRVGTVALKGSAIGKKYSFKALSEKINPEMKIVPDRMKTIKKQAPIERRVNNTRGRDIRRAFGNLFDDEF